MKKYFLYIIILFCVFVGNAQIPIGMPPINNYTEDDYYAGTQNWFTVQDSIGLIYFANTMGILVFDGINWRQISVNDNIVRSLAIDKTGKIWVGTRYDLGYLDIDSIGNYIFVSLKDKIPDTNHDFRDVWNILITKDNTVHFFSQKNIFCYKNDTFQVINPKYKIGRSYLIDDTIYFYTVEEGVRKLINNKTVLIPGSEIFSDKQIKGILKTEENKLLFFTRSNGVYLYDGKVFESIETSIDAQIKDKIYKIFEINNNYLAISLWNVGLLITDRNLNIVKTITIKDGILSNLIWFLYYDKSKNIWLNTNAGISSFALFPSFTQWGENFGLDTKTSKSIIHNKKIYFSNRNGIYILNLSTTNNDFLKENLFTQIKNTERKQNYDIKEVNNYLFATDREGIFTINNNTAHYIKYNKNFREIAKYDDFHIVIGANDGLHLLEFNNEKWIYMHKLDGFDGLSTSIQVDKQKNIWLANKDIGIYKIQLNTQLDSIKTIQLYDETHLFGLPDFKNNDIFKIDDEISFTTSQGIYKYNYKKNIFEPVQEINKYFNGQVLFIFKDTKQNIWLKTKEYETINRQKVTVWNLIKLEKQKDNSYIVIRDIFKNFQSNIYSFNQINDSLFLIGNKKGFTIYNDNIRPDYNFPVLIRSFEYIVSRDSIVVLFNGIYKNKDNKFVTEQPKDKIISLPFKHNSVRFSFSALDYTNSNSLEFSCKLKGFNENWTSWTHRNIKEYTNLKEGKYYFQVKARNVNNIETEVATYIFIVKPPWYRTTWAYIGYFILIISAIYLFVRIYTMRLRKRQEYLERVVVERTAEIMQQNEEIQTQNDMLLDKNNEIEKQKSEIETQRDIAYLQKKEITDSIIYAKRIQEAILPSEKYLKKILPEHFIFFKPRDIVSGDFYWIEKIENIIVIVAADCTGHGVPGAFMSMLGASLLNELVLYNKIEDVGEILNKLRARIKQSLHQRGKDNEATDGMDISLYIINTDTYELQFSGAFNSLYIYQNDIEAENNEPVVLKADRQPIAIYVREHPFNTHRYQLQKNNTIYCFSDGYTDQFGNHGIDKFKLRRFKKLLSEIQEKSMQEQKEIIDARFYEWKGKTEQLDDVLVIGLRV